MTYDLSDLMDRFVVMEKEALATLYPNGVDGVAYYPYQQDEGFPYFTNRIAGMTPDEISADIAQYTYQIEATLVLDNYTAGYKGEVALSAYPAIQAVVAYFRDRPGMDSETENEMDFVFAELRLTNVIGPAVFHDSGEGSGKVGVKFVFSLPVIEEQFR